MESMKLEMPEELLKLLATTKLAGRPPEQQVRIALALFLYEREVTSIGKAAELAVVPRIEFEWLAVQMGMWVGKYDLEDYTQDLRTLDALKQR